jgi:hypothetical protein
MDDCDVLLICAVVWRSLTCKSLMCARDDRRASSGGDSAFVAEVRGALLEEKSAAARSKGEGCPERERRISWSIVVQ